MREGAFGVVTIDAGCSVAKKAFKRPCDAEEGLPYEFLRELAAVTACDLHPSITKLVGFDSDEEHVTLQFTAVTHDLLSYRTSLCGKVNAYEAFSIASQLFGAVGHVHSLGFMHRDVKPANVLVQEMNGCARVRLADFGACVRVISGRCNTILCCTLPYAAPELLRETTCYYDESVDVWSCGIVYAELILGRAIAGGPYTAVRILQDVEKVFYTESFVGEEVHSVANVVLRQMLCMAPSLRMKLTRCKQSNPVLSAMSGWTGSLNAAHRGALLGWMLQVATYLDISMWTMSASVALLDAYVAQQCVDGVDVPVEDLQRYMCDCCLLNCKLSELHPPTTDDFVRLSARSFDVPALVEAEKDLVRTLRGRCSAVPSVELQSHVLRMRGPVK